MKYQKLLESFVLLICHLSDYWDFHKELKCAKQTERQVKLLEYLFECDGAYTDENLSDERILDHLIGEDDPDIRVTTLRDLAYQLNKKIERFLIDVELTKNELRREEFLAAIAKKRGNSRRFLNTATRKVEKVLPDEETAYHQAQAKKYHDAYFHPGATFHHDKKYSAFPRDARFHKDAEHAIFRLKTCAEDLYRKKILGEEIETDFDKDLNAHLAFLPTRVREIPLVILLEDTVCFLNSPTLEGYEKLKQDFVKQLGTIKSEKRIILTSLINGLNLIQYPGGRVKEHFKLFKFGMQHDLIVEYKCISAKMYINIISTACRVNETAWAIDFIKHNQQFLRYEAKTMMNVTSLSNSYVLFSQEKYDKTRDELKKITSRDAFFATRKYILDIMSIYEQIGENVASITLSERCQNFTTYIDKKLLAKKFDDEYGTSLKNFVIMTKELARVKFLDGIKNEILIKMESKSSKMMEKRWILEKINELR